MTRIKNHNNNDARLITRFVNYLILNSTNIICYDCRYISDIYHNIRANIYATKSHMLIVLRWLCLKRYADLTGGMNQLYTYTDECNRTISMFMILLFSIKCVNVHLAGYIYAILFLISLVQHSRAARTSYLRKLTVENNMEFPTKYTVTYYKEYKSETRNARRLLFALIVKLKKISRIHRLRRLFRSLVFLKSKR